MSKESFTGNEIAIIGASGGFPGADGIDEYWENIIGGSDCISHYSKEELKAEGLSPELLEQKNYVRAKGEVRDMTVFDADFFGITPQEAEIMDPQHRMFLECAWEALENAGYCTERHAGIIGVYAGKSVSSYLYQNIFPQLRQMLTMGNLQAAIGNDKDSVTSTISYHMNLKGPSVTIQSSSSTSLVAVCIACQSLLTYQCDMALAGGISVGPPNKCGYLYETGGIMSRDGHTRPFDDASSGFVPGNGYGLVVLKRLDEALADRDHIYAVIKGYAVNNDGSEKISYTAPSVDAHAGVIALAQAMAEVKADTIEYVEAHGTGTRLGDPIEVAAYRKAFALSTQKKSFCALGSVKANIGHLDCAAGVAGLIKVMLALHHQMIPPHINIERVNSEIDFANSPFYINREARRWEKPNGPRRAAVSSLGMGGTNAHVVLEEAPAVSRTPRDGENHILLLSAKTQYAFDENRRRLLAYLQAHRTDNISDASYTLAVGRKPFFYRKAIVCDSADDAIQKLSDGTSFVKCRYNNRRIVFMFPGQGTQYVRMTKGLYENDAAFRDEIDRCAHLINAEINLDIRAIIVSGVTSEDTLHMTQVTQPALFAVEYALGRKLITLGLSPSAMIGHSLGEYAAAAIAGIFSLEDAVKLVCVRSKMMQEVAPGAMTVVGLSPEKLRVVIGDVSLAAINAPEQCVITGTREEIAEAENKLALANVFHKRLKISHAFHSKMFIGMSYQYKEFMNGIKLHKPSIPFISCLTGSLIADAQAVDREYWRRHIVEPVRFGEGIARLLRDESNLFVEVGVGHTLCNLLNMSDQCRQDSAAVSLVRNVKEAVSDEVFFLGALAQLWTHGADIDWHMFYADSQCGRIPMPSYAFDRSRYWIEADLSFHEARQKVREGYDAPTREAWEEDNKIVYHERPRLQSTYEAPANDTERVIVSMLEDLLKIKPIGINDNFFALGGRSLLALRFISIINDSFDISLNINDFFSKETIKDLSDSVDTLLRERSKDLLEEIWEEMMDGVSHEG
jgi:acyl transferase domain-containing protein